MTMVEGLLMEGWLWAGLMLICLVAEILTGTGWLLVAAIACGGQAATLAFGGVHNTEALAWSGAGWLLAAGGGVWAVRRMTRGRRIAQDPNVHPDRGVGT